MAVILSFQLLFFKALRFASLNLVTLLYSGGCVTIDTRVVHLNAVFKMFWSAFDQAKENSLPGKQTALVERCSFA